MNDGSVSILICTRNRAAALLETLKALAAMEFPDAAATEIVVVDNGSTDDTARVVASFTDMPAALRRVSETRTGKSFAYNTAMAEARGKIFLWTDDDVRPPKDWIAGMCAPIVSGAADAVAGGIVMAPHLRRPWMTMLHDVMLASTETLAEDAPTNLTGANMAFHRRVLAKVPAFDVELGPGRLGFQDDVLFSKQLERAGYRIQRRFDVRVEHHFDSDRLLRKSFLDRMVREGESQAYIAHHWEHRDLGSSWKYDAKAALLPLHRLTHPAEDEEEGGVSAREMGWVKDLAFRRRMQIERARPRNYEKFGLVKLSRDTADVPGAPEAPAVRKL